MVRIRWFDREPEDEVPWPHVALITATLFLNFQFWMECGNNLWMPGSLLKYSGVVAGGAVLIAALFFAGPALAAHAAKRPLFEVVGASFGSIPAWGVHLACGLFLATWIGSLVSVSTTWFAPLILRREVSAGQSAAFAAALVVFLFATGLQGSRSSAKLALFSNKLSLALLVAALIRVRDGIPAALRGFESASVESGVVKLWRSFSLLAMLLGPLVLLASGFGRRAGTRKRVALMTGMGIVLPICGALLLVGLVDRATYPSGHGVPSLNPTVAMALWSKIAKSGLPARLMIVAVSMFGASRFGVWALAESDRRLTRLLFVGLGAALAWRYGFSTPFDQAYEATAKCLVVVAAVVTADYVSGRRLAQIRRIDWVGCLALAVGLAMNFLLPPGAGPGDVSNDWWHPWLLPSYGVAFLICLIGRMQRQLGVLHGKIVRITL